jgi:hypothetical protein
MKTWWKFVGTVTLVTILGMVSAVTVSAQEPGVDWAPLAAGESQWFTFEYLGDGSQIEVRVWVDPEDSASFSVWTPEQMELLAAGEEVEPVGRGSVDPYTGCCLIWSGSFDVAGTYQVAVEGPSSGTACYQLDIAGDGVMLPEVEESAAADAAVEATVVEEAAEAEEAAVAEPVTGAAPEVVGGSGPDDALAVSKEFVHLAAGETLWYSFEYVGYLEYETVDDVEDAFWAGSEIEVWLDADPDETVVLSIWTAEQVEQWAAGEEVEPVGRGTANEYGPGEISWAGTFDAPATYYIIVENASAGDASFQLSVAGSDVSSP